MQIGILLWIDPFLGRSDEVEDGRGLGSLQFRQVSRQQDFEQLLEGTEEQAGLHGECGGEQQHPETAELLQGSAIGRVRR